jgi:Uma2 family endonuclease
MERAMSTLSRHLLTAEEFATLPFGDMRYELVRGEIVAMPLAFEDHGETSGRRRSPRM